MDARFIFEQVKNMRPPSFSEEERHCYLAEKMMLRQFVLMKQQEELPDYVSIREMKTWLLTGRNFLEEFQQVIEQTGIDHLFMAELAWTTARHFCLIHMEQEVLKELDEEKRLSHLFRRRVTLEGLQMLLSAVHPAAKQDVQSLLPTLHRKLLMIFGGIQIPACSAGNTKPAQLLELERSTAGLVPELVDTAFRFLLEEPELEYNTEAPSAEIGKLLMSAVAPCLTCFKSVSKRVLLCACTAAARLMVKAVYKTFKVRLRSFHMIDYDESYYAARDGVISAVEDMEDKVQTDELHFSLDEEVDTVPYDVTEDTPGSEEPLVQDSDVQNMYHDVHREDVSSQARLVSPLVSIDEPASMVTLEGGIETSSLLDHRDDGEASPPGDEEAVAVLTDAAEDIYFVPPETPETNVAVSMDDEAEVDVPETQDFCPDEKMGKHGFFRCFWNLLSYYFCVPSFD